MKKIILGLSVLVVFAFTGCGGGGGSSSAGGDTPTVVTMTIGTSYTMSSGGEINKVSDDANVTLETVFSTGETIAKLVDGNATCTGCTEKQ